MSFNANAAQVELVKAWDADVGRAKYLWLPAAITIRDTIRDNSPAEALGLLKAHLEPCRTMGISASYDRAVREVEDLIANAGTLASTGETS